MNTLYQPFSSEDYQDNATVCLFLLLAKDLALMSVSLLITERWPISMGMLIFISCMLCRFSFSSYVYFISRDLSFMQIYTQKYC